MTREGQPLDAYWADSDRRAGLEQGNPAVIVRSFNRLVEAKPATLQEAIDLIRQEIQNSSERLSPWEILQARQTIGRG